MATVIFYEKPGCINNTKQKALLNAAGHELDVRNLLTEAWTAASLRLFFGDRPVVEWFNRTAPQVKSGEVVPEQVDEATALALMIANPILIRRPLIAIGDCYTVGFNVEQLNQWIGLSVGDQASPSESLVENDRSKLVRSLIRADLETCPRAKEADSCPSPEPVS